MSTSTQFRALALFSAAIFCGCLFSSCQKETVIADDPAKGFSADIQRIVPQTTINDLRSRGMVINEGKIPPQMSGAFRVSPCKLLSPYGPADSYTKGDIISDYVYKFYGQNAANAISYDYSNAGSDTGKGQGAFVAGNSNRFTIFSEDRGVSSSISYKTIAVMSGELTTAGIGNFQYAFVMKEKTGDTTDQVLIPVNAGRIWIDGDLLATPTSNARVSASVQNLASARSIAR